MKKDNLREGFISALPIVIGYFPIAMAFGLLAKAMGINFSDTALFSILVYAGASQFMALDLILAGVSWGSIILATFLLNLRHMMMSASLSLKLEKVKKSYLPFVAFGITDETFSVAAFKKGKLSLGFILSLNFLSYGSWVIGTIVGFLIGEILPASLQSSLSIGLYAMFAGLLIPEVKGSKNILYLSIISMIIYSLLYFSQIFGSGWDIIIGIILSSFIGVFIFKGDVKGETNE